MGRPPLSQAEEGIKFRRWSSILSDEKPANCVQAELSTQDSLCLQGGWLSVESELAPIRLFSFSIFLVAEGTAVGNTRASILLLLYGCAFDFLLGLFCFLSQVCALTSRHLSENRQGGGKQPRSARKFLKALLACINCSLKTRPESGKEFAVSAETRSR